MTEAEWNACNDTQRMLEFLTSKASARKLRLFDCACCRRISHLLANNAVRSAVVVIEEFADGLASRADLRKAGEIAWDEGDIAVVAAASDIGGHNGDSA